MQAPPKQNKIIEPHNDILNSMGEQIVELTEQLSKIKVKNSELESKIGKKLSKRCPQGHPLRYMYTITSKKYDNQASKSSFKYCDTCNKKISKQSNVYWSCQHCDFDLCPQIFQLQRTCGGHKNNVCAFDHPLQFIPKFVGSVIKCDICLQHPIQLGWHCDCGFDMCQKCYKFQ